MYESLNNILSNLHRWLNLYRHNALPKKKKLITFYSEGKHYWLCYKGIIDELIKLNYSICYVSSKKDDPGLYYSKKIKSLLIDEKYQRYIFFKSLNTYILITTTPELGTIPDFPKSLNTNHYIYIQHALMSTHYAYKKNAFDNYDIIFCSGQYMIDEIRKTENIYQLSHKKLVKHGYSRLDYLLRNIKKDNNIDKKDTIIFAPTWGGSHSLIENGEAIRYIDSALNQGYKIILRPHPESFKRSPDKIRDIVSKYNNNGNFGLQNDVSDFDILTQSFILITDWSGIAFEYAFTTRNIVLFINTPQKKVNTDYKSLNIIPFEESVRKDIGYIWDGQKNIGSYSKKNDLDKILNKYIFNVLSSDVIASNYIDELIKSYEEL